MARWLLGVKTDEMSASKTFRMLNAFIQNRGDLLNEKKISKCETGTRLRHVFSGFKPVSVNVPVNVRLAPGCAMSCLGSNLCLSMFHKCEMAWLRLAAGCAMLKICEQKGVGDQFNADQFINLSLLMVDEVPQVRELFAAKLHKGLSRGIPQKCLPLDFMGFYALGGLERDKRLKMIVKQNMTADIIKRREYIKNISMGASGNTLSDKTTSQFATILPDYMLVFAVPVLVHYPEYTSHDNADQLEMIRQCLWFILEPLMTKNDSYCFGFYKDLIEKMKNHKDAIKGDDDSVNFVLENDNCKVCEMFTWFHSTPLLVPSRLACCSITVTLGDILTKGLFVACFLSYHITLCNILVTPASELMFPRNQKWSSAYNLVPSRLLQHKLNLPICFPIHEPTAMHGSVDNRNREFGLPPG
uniref:(California timema) hypothetical protein n=1 Tax=Timema californicum TaxID=61474 RepID=A0A7R9PD32_TIMCA|nr:unnamed protein product [Timema californicum]